MSHVRNMSVVIVFAVLSCAAFAQAERLPNIVVIFADDLGYGDLSCYGHPTIATPNLDRMANEGTRFTQFYVGASVCTPSRAALMTGRLPIRSGMCGGRRVLFPDSAGGIPDSELTIAELLKAQGYATTCIGKWHLGHLPQYLPTRHGFDSYFGIPYSNDMKPAPVMRNEEIVEDPAVQETLTQRYTAEAVKFIKKNKDKPFFLYFPHTFPHVPLFASEKFKDTSLRGLYGDVVEEVDWSVGQVLDTLRELKLDDNTLVVFTSDNGPWLVMKERGGSASLLRHGKGTTWEGGMRVPAIAWWPGKVKAGRLCREIACTMDLLPTAAALSGAELPDDVIYDGEDISPILFGDAKRKGDTIFYYRNTNLWAVRMGKYKAHFITQGAYQPNDPLNRHESPLLFDLDHDPSEQFNIADKHPEVVAKIKQIVEDHNAQLVKKPAQLEKKIAKK